MSSLTEQSCEACRAGAPHLTDAEFAAMQADIPEWSRVVIDGVARLERQYRFANFVDALGFANLVGEEAEAEGHHPALLVEWGKIRVSWWTHKIGGLHRNDIIMAAKTDALFVGLEP
jgi:pterin-4-alpha-carbinolamine dehydratase (EC 4.2.1.96)